MSSDSPRMESPLAGYRFGESIDQADAGLRLEERELMGHVNLRGERSDALFAASIRSALGFDVPAAANTFVYREDKAAIWLGPGEWLIITPTGDEPGLCDRLRRSLTGIHGAVTDISGGQTVFRLSGPRVRDVLAKGCTLDLHPRAFGPGQCAQTNIAHAAATLLQIDDSPTYDVIIRRSFAGYLALWIEDAASEYGLSVA